MAITKKMICPMRGSECIEDGTQVEGEIHACPFWTVVVGSHPQTGEVVNNGNCAITWLPILLIENTKVARGMTAATESHRNEVVKASESAQRLLSNAMASMPTSQARPRATARAGTA